MRYRYRSTDSSQSNTIAIHLNMKDSKKKSRKMVNKHMEAKDSQKKKTIELLHEYNDLKDATQLVLGALATLKSVPIRSVYSTYNLPVEE
ncbi:DNA repair protein SWI5 homolog [Drosophila rhopaloa]|nr:DNA repair protein SWI5 homolog [Drosophila rhopaloa]XP_044313601.1 DNA repair protein SWI5 homolog [Drosophila rhopaloa]